MSRRTARDVVMQLLVAVDQQQAYANLTLPRLLAGSRLSERDRALATELGYGTLRAQGSLDRLIGLCSHRPLATLDPPVRAALRLGAYQLLHTRTPPHAAVTTAVDAASAAGGKGAAGSKGPAGFVNAVLRAVAARVAGSDPLGLADVEDPAERLGIEHAHPAWVVAAFAAALDGDPDQTAMALAADNTRPVTHLVARPGRIGRDELLAAAGPGAHPGVLSPYAVHLDAGGDPGRLAAVRDGRAGVQDEGSQLCALALHRAAPDGLLVDLCAGPGGKAALLAALRPGRVVALERAPHRAALVRGTGLTAVAVADARRPPLRPGAAGVLVDAPCTGLGSLRRRPEARWRRSPDEVAGLVTLQRELLAAAVALVRPGGVVAYSVCSPLLAEAVVAPPPGTEVLDAAAVLGLAPRPAPPGGPGRLQLWPHRDGTDAMALTLLRVTGRP